MLLRRLVAGLSAAALAAGALVAAPALAVTSAPIATIDAVRTVTGASGDVVLAWNAVAGAATYKVEIADDRQFGSANIVDQVTTPARTWVPTSGLWGTSSERTLFWRVVPQGVGASAQDAPVYEFTRNEAPAPSLLAPASDALIAYPAPTAFSWNPVPGAMSYTLEYGRAGSSEAATVTTTSPTYAPAAALAFGTWWWKVRANFPVPGTTSATYAGPFSGERSFTTEWPVAASRPQLLTPADGAVLNDVVLTWSRVPGASKYTVQLSLDEEFTKVELTSVVSGTAFALTRPLPSVTYYWRVRATDSAGRDGAFSAARQLSKRMGIDATAEATTSLGTVAPVLTVGSPSAQAPEVIPFDQFALTWEPVPRATFYEVTVAQLNGGPPVTCKTASTTATIIARYVRDGNQQAKLDSAAPCLWSTQANRAIEPGSQVYSVKVRAVNVGAHDGADYQGISGTGVSVVPSAESEPRYFTITADGRDETVDVIPDRAFISSDEVSPDLTWAPVAGAGGYQVDIYTDASYSSLVGRLWTRTPALTVNGVFSRNTTTASDDAYFARITAMDGGRVEATNWARLVGPAHGAISWKRMGEAPSAATVEAVAGMSLLRLSPAPADLLGGTNRGYRVLIDHGDGTTKVAELDVDQPATLAVKDIAYSGSTDTLTSLPTGRYEIRYAVLDAARKPGPFSSRTSFNVGQGTVESLEAAVLPSRTSATLTWTPSVSATSYDVYLGAEGTSPQRVAGGRGQTTFVAESLRPATKYSWYVVSIDKDGNRSESSAPTSFTTTPAALTTAGDVSAPAGSLRLSWGAVTGASRYLVRVRNSMTQAVIELAETSARSWSPTKPLVYGTQYTWDVRAVPETPYTTTSTTRPFLAQSAESLLTVSTPPGAVTSVKAVVDGRTATVTWPALSGAALGSSGPVSYALAYRVKPDLATEDGWTVLPAVPNGLSQTVTGLALATAYEFRVIASNADGSGPWSRTTSGTTATMPSAVRSLTATGTLNGLKVTWTSPASTGGSRITGYTVAYRTGGAAWRSTTTTSTSITLEGLAGRTSYDVRVAAINAIGAGPLASVTASTMAAPSAPRYVKVKRGDRKATVTWSVPATDGGSVITRYTIQMRTKTGRSWSSWSSRGSTSGTRSYVASGLTNGTGYQFRVVAANRLAEGAVSAAVSVTPAGKPFAPQGVKVTAYKGKTKVSWKAAASNGSKITAYYVQYSTNGKKWKSIKTAKSSARSYTTKVGKKGKMLYFRVIAKNALGKSPASSVVMVVKK